MRYHETQSVPDEIIPLPDEWDPIDGYRIDGIYFETTYEALWYLRFSGIPVDAATDYLTIVRRAGKRRLRPALRALAAVPVSP